MIVILLKCVVMFSASFVVTALWIEFSERTGRLRRPLDATMFDPDLLQW